LTTQYLYNKRACPTKNEPQQQEISNLKRERERGGRAGQQAGIFKVRLGLGEIQKIQRYRDIQRHRNKET
jgi:hypothetical protein